MDIEAVKTFLKNQKIASSMKLILIALAGHAYNEEDNNIYPSITTLQKETGYSRPTITNNIAIAEEMGLIRVERKKGKPSQYTILTGKVSLPVNSVYHTSKATLLPLVKPVYRTGKVSLPERSIKEESKELSKELQVVVDKFHELGPRLPRCRKLNATLKAKLRTRLKDKAWFDEFCEAVRLADERLGHRTTEWKPRLEYFLRNDDNVQSILEGKFKKYKEIPKCGWKECTDPAVRFGYCVKHAGS